MNRNERYITIGITVFQEGKLLIEAWNSILNQKNNKWEAVMVLDGGADYQTENYFDNISHPSLKKIKLQQNKGPYFSRTLAIENSVSDWYCHLDADDKLPPDMVDNIYSTIDKFPNIQYIIGNCLYFDLTEFYINDHSGISDIRLAYTLPFNGTSPIKLDLYYELGGFCKELYNGGADWDFWLGVAESKALGTKIDNILYERRFRKNNVGSKWRHRYYQVAELLVNRHPIFFSKDNRKKTCLYKSYELSAREYKKLGKREQAAKLANVAIRYDDKQKNMLNIIKEGEMSIWRYLLRRLGRRINI